MHDVMNGSANEQPIPPVLPAQQWVAGADAVKAIEVSIRQLTQLQRETGRLLEDINREPVRLLPVSSHPPIQLPKRQRSSEGTSLVESIDPFSEYAHPFPEVNWQVGDIGTPAYQSGLTYQDDRKRGDLLPVYLNEWQLRDIRLRSRKLCYFNEFAICGIENRVNYVVGDGFTYVASPADPNDRGDRELAKDTQAVIDLFVEVNEMCEIEADFMRRLDQDGEGILRLFPEADGICHLRFVQPEHLRSMIGSNADPRFSYGVITDPDDIETVEAYSVVDNPNHSWNPRIVDAGEIVHVKLNVPKTAKRGCPTYFPVQANLDRCEQLLQSMTHLARVRAKLALIIQLTRVTSDTAQKLMDKLANVRAKSQDGSKDLNVNLMPPGYVPTIPANMEIKSNHPQLGASDFVEVLQAELRAVASRLQMPEWMFTALADAKYSNAFVVEAPTLRTFKRLQRLLTGAFGNRRYKQRMSLVWRQIRHAVNCGILPREVFTHVTVECKGPPLETRDKAAEANRAQGLVKNRLSSRKTQIQELGYDPDEETERITAETVGERRPVQDMTAVSQVQTTFYSGQLPKPAAVALVRVVLGFDEKTAEALFPGEPTPQPQPVGPGLNEEPGAGGGGAGENPLASILSGGEPGPKPPDAGNPSAGQPLTEQIVTYIDDNLILLREQWTPKVDTWVLEQEQRTGQRFTGRVVDSLNRVYYYIDGRRVKGNQAEQVHGGDIKGDKVSAVAAKTRAKELHKLATETPHLLTAEHMAELPKLLAAVPVSELKQMAAAFGTVSKGKLKDEHITALAKAFPIPAPVAVQMGHTDEGKAYLARLSDLDGATIEQHTKIPSVKPGPDDDESPSVTRERRASYRDDFDSIGRERAASRKNFADDPGGPGVDTTPDTPHNDVTSNTAEKTAVQSTPEPVPATRPGTSAAKGIGRLASDVLTRGRKPAPAGPQIDELQSHKLAASAGVGTLHRLSSTERDQLKAEIKAAGSTADVQEVEAKARAMHGGRSTSSMPLQMPSNNPFQGDAIAAARQQSAVESKQRAEYQLQLAKIEPDHNPIPGVDLSNPQHRRVIENLATAIDQWTPGLNPSSDPLNIALGDARTQIGDNDLFHISRRKDLLNLAARVRGMLVRAKSTGPSKVKQAFGRELSLNLHPAVRKRFEDAAEVILQAEEEIKQAEQDQTRARPGSKEYNDAVDRRRRVIEKKSEAGKVDMTP